jgi:hypothetical protein
MVTFPTLQRAPAEGASDRHDGQPATVARAAPPGAGGAGLAPPVTTVDAPAWWLEWRAAVLRDEWARRAREAQAPAVAVADTRATAARRAD